MVFRPVPPPFSVDSSQHLADTPFEPSDSAPSPAVVRRPSSLSPTLSTMMEMVQRDWSLLGGSCPQSSELNASNPSMMSSADSCRSLPSAILSDACSSAAPSSEEFNPLLASPNLSYGQTFQDGPSIRPNFSPSLPNLQVSASSECVDVPPNPLVSDGFVDVPITSLVSDCRDVLSSPSDLTSSSDGGCCVPPPTTSSSSGSERRSPSSCFPCPRLRRASSTGGLPCFWL